MMDENLLAIFLAVTALAILIQTGILVGFYVLSAKLSRQADQALDVTRTFLGPLQSTVESLQSVVARLAEFSSRTQGQLRQFVRPKG
jgi:hypothetical protein